MRRLTAVLGILVVLLGLPARAAGQAAHPFPDDVALFTQYIESLRIQTGIPGLAAAIVGPDRLLWEHGFGQQDLEQFVAVSPDTPFHLDGLTQLFAASIVLRCVEEGSLLLDDPIGSLIPGSPEPAATIRQLLAHASGTSDNLAFAYRPERLESLSPVIEECAGASFRQTLMDLFDRLAMPDSVPGPDTATAERYRQVLRRLAVPYVVDSRRRARPSQYAATTLSTFGGLISTVRDFAQFDVALRNGLLLRSDTLAAAWQPAVGAAGRQLPHGLGWFVQPYNGQVIVWQFGVEENAGSSFVMTLPNRGLTLVLLANSSGLVKPFPLAAGDITVSPFARLFLGLFAR